MVEALVVDEIGAVLLLKEEGQWVAAESASVSVAL